MLERIKSQYHRTQPKTQFSFSFIWVANTRLSCSFAHGSSKGREQISGNIPEKSNQSEVRSSVSTLGTRKLTSSAVALGPPQ